LNVERNFSGKTIKGFALRSVGLSPGQKNIPGLK